jgi:hypothetical protein
MGVYATIKVTDRSKGGFSRLLMEYYMIELENTATFSQLFQIGSPCCCLGIVIFFIRIDTPFIDVSINILFCRSLVTLSYQTITTIKEEGTILYAMFAVAQIHRIFLKK